MGTIIKKKIKGNNYYYYVESKRINGKSHYVNQKYLGSADKLLKMAVDAEKPLQEQTLYASETDFGAVALLYDFAMKLGVAEMIDAAVPQGRQGASVGMYILIAAINCAVAPTSRMKEWYESTSLPYITGLRPSLFTAHNFWSSVHISEEQLEQIEDALVRKSIDWYHLDAGMLIYDTTNFFSYMDTMNPSEYGQTKRSTLRTAALPLFVDPEFAIPLVSGVYLDNCSDANRFADTAGLLRKRCEAITGGNPAITVIFEQCHNSGGNPDILRAGDAPFHYVGRLKKNQAPELFAVPKKAYIPLACPENAAPKYRQLTVYRTEVTVFGRKTTAVIVNDHGMEKEQLQGIGINISKTKNELVSIQARLMKRAGGEITEKPTVGSVKAAAEEVLKKREYMEEIFEYEVIEKDGCVYLSFSDSEQKLDHITETQLGKTALFTDLSGLSNYEIVSAYQSVVHAESAFAQMRDTNFLTVSPTFHWTDEKIRIHIFICVLAYRLCSLLRKELADKGIFCSINQMLDSMSSIKRGSTFYGDSSKPRQIEAFLKGDELAMRIEGLYHLQAKYCKRL